MPRYSGRWRAKYRVGRNSIWTPKRMELPTNRILSSWKRSSHESCAYQHGGLARRRGASGVSFARGPSTPERRWDASAIIDARRVARDRRSVGLTVSAQRRNAHSGPKANAALADRFATGTRFPIAAKWVRAVQRRSQRLSTRRIDRSPAGLRVGEHALGFGV